MAVSAVRAVSQRIPSHLRQRQQPAALLSSQQYSQRRGFHASLGTHAVDNRPILRENRADPPSPEALAGSSAILNPMASYISSACGDSVYTQSFNRPLPFSRNSCAASHTRTAIVDARRRIFGMVEGNGKRSGRKVRLRCRGYFVNRLPSMKGSTLRRIMALNSNTTRKPLCLRQLRFVAPLH